MKKKKVYICIFPSHTELLHKATDHQDLQNGVCYGEVRNYLVVTLGMVDRRVSQCNVKYHTFTGFLFIAQKSWEENAFTLCEKCIMQLV